MVNLRWNRRGKKRGSRLIALTAALSLGGGALLASRDATAHCDMMDGPVVQSARTALNSGKVEPALRWVGPKDEPEVRAAFKSVLAVRANSPESKAVADRFFFETVVRLHRAGEGEPFTGVKPSGTPIDPVIKEADLSLEQGNVDHLAKAIAAEVEEGIRHRFREATTRKKTADSSVSEGRRFVAAYVGYVHYVEALKAAAGGSGHASHAEPNAEEAHGK